MRGMKNEIAHTLACRCAATLPSTFISEAQATEHIAGNPMVTLQRLSIMGLLYQESNSNPESIDLPTSVSISTSVPTKPCNESATATPESSSISLSMQSTGKRPNRRVSFYLFINGQ